MASEKSGARPSPRKLTEGDAKHPYRDRPSGRDARLSKLGRERSQFGAGG